MEENAGAVCGRNPQGTQIFSLEGKVALITGAAGRLGRSFCKAMSWAGARLAITDVDCDACRELAEDLSSRNARHIGLGMDVTRGDSVRGALKEVVSGCGRVDILVNNAGVGVFTPFEMRSEEEFQEVVDVNLKGVFLCCQAISAQMMTQGSGTIINIGSIYGVVSSTPEIYGDSGRNNSEVYSASKAAVIQLTRYLAVYLARYNIRVNCISPGGVFNHQGRDFVDAYCKLTPLNRMAAASDLDGSLLFLASDASSYVSGHNIIVDGGFTVR